MRGEEKASAELNQVLVQAGNQALHRVPSGGRATREFEQISGRGVWLGDHGPSTAGGRKRAWGGTDFPLLQPLKR